MDNRGYTTYRGRGGGGRPLLTLLLICVILASAGFILVREQMMYDEQGALRFQFPWEQDDPPPPEREPSADVEIEVPEPPEETERPRRGRLLDDKPLTLETLAAAEALLEDGERLAVTLKDAEGKVYFDSAAALPDALEVKGDTAEALARLTTQGAVGRICCFLDPRASQADVEGRGLKNTGGYIFYDGTYRRWLDPGKEGARAYLLALIGEVAALGFEEILLTEVSYPTQGKLHKIDFSHLPQVGAAGRQEAITTFVREVREILPEGVTLSIALTAQTIRSGEDGDAGQNLAQLAPLVEHIYAPAAADEVEALSAAVQAASEGCRFVPEMTQVPEEGTEHWLLVKG